MKLPRRKWRVTLHMRSGAKLVVVCRNFKKRSGESGEANEISSITAEGGQLPFYTRLDAIDAIICRRSWSHWYWGAAA